MADGAVQALIAGRGPVLRGPVLRWLTGAEPGQPVGMGQVRALMRAYACVSGGGLLLSLAFSPRAGWLRVAAALLVCVAGASWSWRRGRRRPAPAWVLRAGRSERPVLSWVALVWPGRGWAAAVGGVVELLALAVAPVAGPSPLAALAVLFAVCNRHCLRSSRRRAAAAVAVSVAAYTCGVAMAESGTPTPASLAWLVAPALSVVATCAAVLLLTEALAAAAACRASEETSHAHLRAVVDASPAGLALLDADGRVRWANTAAATLLGVSPERLAAVSISSLPPSTSPGAAPADQNAAVVDVVTRARAGERCDEVLRWVRPDGSVVQLAISASTVVLPGTRQRDVLTVLSDVTERHDAEQELRRRATVDDLTGLVNRTVLFEELAGLGRAAAHDTHAVLLIDLDGFKHVNDAGGHATGDRLLQQIATRLRRSVRRGDTVARLGGDEFAVLLRRSTDSTATAVTEALLEAVRTVVRLPDGAQARITGSIGLTAVVPGDDRSAADILADADLAMYAAKQAGRDRSCVFTPEMRRRVTDRLHTETDLRAALREDEIVVHFQPYLDLATGRMIGMEALARWHHPTRGLLGPTTFIGLAEDTGLIVELGQEVLEQAVTQLRSWQRAVPGADELTVSVNLSVRQLTDPGLTGMIADVLARTGLPAGCLILELTESLLAETEPTTVAALHRLKELGVRLAVDDFGTGFSSLAYLQRFPLDVLKVDRSFVRGLHPGDPSPITAAIVGLAQSLGLHTIAEGIETADQAAALRQLGCSAGQGYLYARPMPAARLTERLPALLDPATRTDVALPSLAS